MLLVRRAALLVGLPERRVLPAGALPGGLPRSLAGGLAGRLLTVLLLVIGLLLAELLLVGLPVLLLLAVGRLLPVVLLAELLRARLGRLLLLRRLSRGLPLLLAEVHHRVLGEAPRLGGTALRALGGRVERLGRRGLLHAAEALRLLRLPGALTGRRDHQRALHLGLARLARLARMPRLLRLRPSGGGPRLGLLGVRRPGFRGGRRGGRLPRLGRRLLPALGPGRDRDVGAGRPVQR
ncbi:hypothetical protein DMH08_26105, partial [Actinomadura sp. WAC 06369]